jgi:hypothetical protein
VKILEVRSELRYSCFGFRVLSYLAFNKHSRIYDTDGEVAQVESILSTGHCHRNEDLLKSRTLTR